MPGRTERQTPVEARDGAAHDLRTPPADGPDFRVAPSGTVSIEVAELAPYFLPAILPTKEEVRGYIEGTRANTKRQEQGTKATPPTEQ